MKNIKVYGRLATRTKSGSRSRKFSLRTKLAIPSGGTLVVDLEYFASLFTSRPLLERTALSWLYSLLYSSKCVSVRFTCENPSSQTVSQLISWFGCTVSIGLLPNLLHSTLLQSPTSNFIVFTDNISCWGLNNFKANMVFVFLDTNQRLVYYNNRTGLDFFCKFIRTNKIINKLGLDNLKYINLQYLYIMLLYLAFKHQKYKTVFSFSEAFFKPYCVASRKSFFYSKGVGLDLISETHKLLSYAFLTKPEYCDYFLFGTDYELQLTRLQKLLPLDITLLTHFQAFVHRNYPYTVSATLVPSQLHFSSTVSKPLEAYAYIINKLEPSTSTTKRHYMRLQNRLGSGILSNTPTACPEEDITQYVANLLSGSF